MGDSPNNSMSVTSGSGGQPTSHTPTIMPPEIDNFMRQLASDRLIKICLGEGAEQKQFVVPENILTARSKYFKKAIENETSMGTQAPGTLCFPEDGHLVAAWGMMLHWIIHHRLPIEELEEENLVLYTEAWALGDKYLLPQFENVVMMELINYVDDCHLPCNEPELVRSLLRITPANSPIRRLWAEETIYVMYGPSLPKEGRMTSEDLIGMEAVIGITTSLLNALRAFPIKGHFHRCDYSKEEHKMYEQYLVPE